MEQKNCGHKNFPKNKKVCPRHEQKCRQWYFKAKGCSKTVVLLKNGLFLFELRRA